MSFLLYRSPELLINLAYIPAGMDVTLKWEIGMLGIGPFLYEGDEDSDLINAGKQTISELAQSTYFVSDQSFAMIRGGNIDLTVLGATDLVAGFKKIIVVMEHCAKDGSPQFIPSCTLPLTGKNVVDMIVTDLAVFQRPNHDLPFHLVEMAPGVTKEEIAAKTTAHYIA